MTLGEAIHLWGPHCSGLALATAPTTRLATIPATRSSSSLACSSPQHLIHPQSSSLERSIGVLSTSTLPRKGSRTLPCRAKEKDGDENERDDEGFDKSGFGESGYDRFGYDKFGYDRKGFNKYGIPRGAILDGKIYDPDYVSYTDPSTGEPAPTYGARTPLPNAAFWGEDLKTIQNSKLGAPKDSSSGNQGLAGNAQTTRNSKVRSRRESSSKSQELGEAHTVQNSKLGSRRTTSKGLELGQEDGDVGTGRTGGRKRRSAGNGRKKSAAQVEELSEEERANREELKILSEKFREEGKKYEVKLTEETTQKSEAKVEKKKAPGEDEEVVEVEEEDRSLLKVMSDKGYALVRPDASTENKEEPLPNDELWWNWRKPPPDKQTWSAWQKRAGDSDTVMAAAMAETGQIKLYGEKPTLTEATLARARKKVFYDERIAAEEERKKEIGAMAYYKEWVKGWKQDTSKEAVQKHFMETGEEEGIQLLDMFAHQTLGEYRNMQGTDVRIKRDPLTMRMRPDQIKQVWGGDPVYPTINYIEDPDAWFDPRNENMHEPIPDILDVLRKSGRLITQDELQALLDAEKAEEEEFDEFDGLSEAVDIGEEDEDENDDEEDALEGQPQVGNIVIGSIPSKKKVTTEEDIFDI